MSPARPRLGLARMKRMVDAGPHRGRHLGGVFAMAVGHANVGGDLGISFQPSDGDGDIVALFHPRLLRALEGAVYTASRDIRGLVSRLELGLEIFCVAAFNQAVAGTEHKDVDIGIGKNLIQIERLDGWFGGNADELTVAEAPSKCKIRVTIDLAAVLDLTAPPLDPRELSRCVWTLVFGQIAQVGFSGPSIDQDVTQGAVADLQGCQLMIRCEDGGA